MASVPQGKVDRVDLSHLTFEEAVKQAWEAEPPEKDGKKRKTADEAEREQEQRIARGEERPR
jgi:hypothetical protein